MTREQELEKMMKWIGHCLVNTSAYTGYVTIEYVGLYGVAHQSGKTFEECIRKAMQQEGDL